MNDLELVIWTACREADEKFERDGAAGTKEWIREYLFPSLERHGLEIRKKPERCGCCAGELPHPPGHDCT